MTQSCETVSHQSFDHKWTGHGPKIFNTENNMEIEQKTGICAGIHARHLAHQSLIASAEWLMASDRAQASLQPSGVQAS
jgi:hypothetical protein